MAFERKAQQNFLVAHKRANGQAGALQLTLSALAASAFAVVSAAAAMCLSAG
jgi:hypothetical protein